MRHAARKAAWTSGISRCFRPVPSSPEAKASGSEGNGAVIGLDPAVLDKLNEIAPMTRRSMRQAARAAERHNMLIGSASLAALVGTAAAAMAFANPDERMALASDAATTTTQMQRISAAASRSGTRASLDGSAKATATQQTSNEGAWSLGDVNADLDIGQMSRSLADNPNVAKLMDDDNGVLPAGFNPNHATGDSGNAYDAGQCTWWAYTRRTQLGLPVGSHFGNGNMWASSARALGYWVDNTPRHVGDIMVFAAGQQGADATAGHVAIVEKINADGSVTVSEYNANGNGAASTRTFSNVSDFQYIHY